MRDSDWRSDRGKQRLDDNMEQRTVEADKANWKAWPQGTITAAVNRDLPIRIYRLSAGPHYVSGPYAARRVGTPLDPLEPPSMPVPTYDHVPVVDFEFTKPDHSMNDAPDDHPVLKQRTVEQMFGGPSSSNS